MRAHKWVYSAHAKRRSSWQPAPTAPNRWCPPGWGGRLNIPMFRPILSFVILVTVGPGFSAVSDASQKRSVPEMLTLIAQPQRSERVTTQKRFKFLVPRFVRMCDDIGTPMKASDMLVFSWKEMEKAGLGSEEGLLALSNNLFSIASQVSALGLDTMKCAEWWSAYLVARQETGMSQSEAKAAVIGIARALLSK